MDGGVLLLSDYDGGLLADFDDVGLASGFLSFADRPLPDYYSNFGRFILKHNLILFAIYLHICC